jgi:hypothetical protein
MDADPRADRPAGEDAEPITPDERSSKVGDLGRGSHEQTQGGDDKAPGHVPGNKVPPEGPA